MLRPRVKRSLDPVRRLDGTIRIGTFQSGIAFELADAHGVIWEMLGLLDGTRSVGQVLATLHERHATLDIASVASSLEALFDAGVCEDATAPPPELDAEELLRTSRSVEYLSWVDTHRRSNRWETQLCLKRARVVVAGLGGAGSSVAMALVASGIGHLRVLDFDCVECSNLNRQILYAESDVGRSKVDAAVERLRGMNRFVDVQGESLRIDGSDVIAEHMRDASLFILCADTPAGEIVRWTSTAALKTRTPWMLSGYAGPVTLVATHVPFETGCIECGLLTTAERVRANPDYEYAERLLTGAATNAVMAPTAAIAGNLAALEAIYFLTGLGPRTLGRTLNQNLIHHEEVAYFDNPRRPDCPACAIDPLAARAPA